MKFSDINNLVCRRSPLIVCLLAVLGTFGCTAINTLPLEAKPGDTIIMTVGSPEGMITSGPLVNTTITWTPWSTTDCDSGSATGTAVPLTAKGQFNLYPDKTSPAWLDGNTALVESGSGHAPYTTTLAIDLPITGLTVSHGCLNINTAATYPLLQTHINSIPINLEILSGMGSPNPLIYELLGGIRKNGVLSDLAPKRRIAVKPAFTGAGTTAYAAIEINVTIPSLGLVVDPQMIVVADEKTGFTGFKRGHYTWSQSDDDVKVIFISPIGMLEYYDAHFFIVSDPIMALIDTASLDVGNITVSATYYDLDGAVVAGPSLTIIDET